jgi:polyol permease family
VQVQVNVSSERRILGMQPRLLWGFISVFLFMVGDGIEQAFLSKYVVQLGFSLEQSAVMFSVYGITLALASWLAGVLSEVFGSRRVMMLGLFVWVVFDVGFLLALTDRNYILMLIMYGLRGFGYPLFAFSFIVWVTYVSERSRLASAMGVFWFMFAGGIGFVGTYYPSFTLPVIGYMGTLWSALIWIVIGGVWGIVLTDGKYQQGTKTLQSGLREFSAAVRILWKQPRVAIGGVVRTINTSAWFGLVVVFPVFFTSTLHFSTSQWLQIWGDQSISNMVFNVIWGVVGDKIGWSHVVKWFGGIGCAISTLLYYYGALAVSHNFWLTVVIACLFGATVAAFVPLSAIMPFLAPKDRGAAMAILNLGAGLSNFAGPALVALLNPVLSLTGVVWSFAILYIFSSFLTHKFLRTDSEAVREANREMTDSILDTSTT